MRWPQDLPRGVYRLQLADTAKVHEELPLIVAPARAFAGDFDRGWLLAVSNTWSQNTAPIDTAATPPTPMPMNSRRRCNCTLIGTPGYGVRVSRR